MAIDVIFPNDRFIRRVDQPWRIVGTELERAVGTQPGDAVGPRSDRETNLVAAGFDLAREVLHVEYVRAPVTRRRQIRDGAFVVGEFQRTITIGGKRPAALTEIVAAEVDATDGAVGNDVVAADYRDVVIG